jgi:hypothetical protein
MLSTVAAITAAPGDLRAHHGVLPRIIVGPVKRKLLDASGGLHRFERSERRFEDRILKTFVERFPGCMAQRKIEEDSTWRIHRLRNRKGTRQTQRRNPLRFDLPRDQSHGLMTNRSDRDQQDEIHLVFDHASRKLRSQFFTNAACRVDSAHAGIRVPTLTAEPTARDAPMQGPDR